MPLLLGNCSIETDLRNSILMGWRNTSKGFCLVFWWQSHVTDPKEMGHNKKGLEFLFCFSYHTPTQAQMFPHCLFIESILSHNSTSYRKKMKNFAKMSFWRRNFIYVRLFELVRKFFRMSSTVTETFNCLSFYFSSLFYLEKDIYPHPEQESFLSRLFN